MDYKRPDSIPYPKIWKEFEGLKEINGQKPKFWIQDVTEDMVEKIIQTMLMDFIQQEPLCHYAKLIEDEVSVAEICELYKYLVHGRLAFACMIKDSSGRPKIAGITSLDRVSINDPKLQCSGKVISKLMDLVDYMFGVENPFTRFGVSEYLTDKGIYVLPEFRGQGICVEFLKCWAIICKTLGFKVVIGIFTSRFSQSAAIRTGYTDLFTISHMKLKETKPEHYYQGIEEHTDSIRLLYVELP